MIALYVWGAVALVGVVVQGRAWSRTRSAMRFMQAQDAPWRYLVMARNNRRRYFWRTLICSNNLLLAIALELGILSGHGRPPMWLGTIYYATSLIANEAVIILLTWLDGRAERKVGAYGNGG